MSPFSKANPAAANSASESLAPEPRFASWIQRRESSSGPRQTLEGFVSELALRLASAASLNEALPLVQAALREHLPDCTVTFDRRDNLNLQADPSSSAGLAEGGCESTAQLLERCEWSLFETEPADFVLSIQLPRSRQPCDVAEALDVGAQVASLLRAVARLERVRQALRIRTDELLELRRRIIQADKLAGYGQLVASALHDLNSPLTAMVAYSEYLTQTLATKGVDPSDLERLSRVRDAAQAVLRQSRRLLEYACPPRTPFTKVDLVEVIQRALALCEHEFTRSRIEVRTALGDDLPCTFGHAEHLTQLFVNLFTNAAQAARPERGWLSIGASVELLSNSSCRRLAVAISDNGSGIAPADLEHVFDAFYTTKTGTGCGLGLAIVRDIVEHHRGAISVVSEPLVETTFTVVLPTSDAG